MRLSISRTLTATAIFLSVVLLVAEQPHNKTARTFVAAPTGLSVVAHAGSGLPQGTRSNSMNAIDQAVKNGFFFIEIDFSWTSDRKIVAIHNWKDTYFNWFQISRLQRAKYGLGFSPDVPDLATFNSMSMRYDLQQAELSRIMKWLEDNPSVRIITDVKVDNLVALKEIAERYPEMMPQVIPQIYSPDEYAPAINMGWSNLILTTYRNKLTINEIVEFTNTHLLFALTIPLSMLSDRGYKDLVNLKTPIFIHTINFKDLALLTQEKGFSGIYTDYFLPQI